MIKIYVYWIKIVEDGKLSLLFQYISSYFLIYKLVGDGEFLLLFLNPE
jgi:hypothetical protein